MDFKPLLALHTGSHGLAAIMRSSYAIQLLTSNLATCIAAYSPACRFAARVLLCNSVLHSLAPPQHRSPAADSAKRPLVHDLVYHA